jgi:hypothetical protein
VPQCGSRRSKFLVLRDEISSSEEEWQNSALSENGPGCMCLVVFVRYELRGNERCRA